MDLLAARGADEFEDIIEEPKISISGHATSTFLNNIIDTSVTITRTQCSHGPHLTRGTDEFEDIIEEPKISISGHVTSKFLNNIIDTSVTITRIQCSHGPTCYKGN